MMPRVVPPSPILKRQFHSPTLFLLEFAAFETICDTRDLKHFGFMSSATRFNARESSPLLDKARQFGLSLPLDLERLAVARGCHYYERNLPPRVPPIPDAPLSNAELAIALIAPSLEPSAREVRLSAALLGTPDIRPDEVAFLSVRENCADV